MSECDGVFVPLPLPPLRFKLEYNPLPPGVTEPKDVPRALDPKLVPRPALGARTVAGWGAIFCREGMPMCVGLGLGARGMGVCVRV